MSSVDLGTPDAGTQAIEVWRVPLVAPEATLATYRQWLSADEIRRADRYLRELHRTRFLVGRARLRLLLARHLDVTPREIEFAYDPLGKPRLKSLPATIHVTFNFSNAADQGLLAVSHATIPLGVDLEQIRPLSDLLGLARRFFHEEEVAALERLSGALREATFFRCWTRKEAYLKAVGKGLTFPLNQVLVNHEDDSMPSIRAIAGSVAEARDWHMRAWDFGQGFLAALAYQSPEPFAVNLREWK